MTMMQKNKKKVKVKVTLGIDDFILRVCIFPFMFYIYMSLILSC